MPQLRNSNNLATTIGSISTGGGTPVERKDINFFDYDGTLLHSYTFAESVQLSALPALPTHSGLTAQGWNYTLAQIQTAAQSGHPVDAGASFVTSDGSTKLYFYVAKGTRISNLRLYVNMEANTSASVDWGDGTTSTISNTGSSSANVYTQKTDYAEVNVDTVLCVKIIGGSFKIGISNSTSLSMFNVDANRIPPLIKAEIGSNCTRINKYAFSNCVNLKTITIPQSVLQIDAYAFYVCSSLRAVVFPNSIVQIDQYAFSNCYGLTVVSLPQSINNNFFAYALYNNYSLRSIVLPIGVRYIRNDLLYNCRVLDFVALPPGMTEINDYSVANCYSLVKIKIPNSVTFIGSRAFYNDGNLYEVDLTAYTDPTQIPTLYDDGAFDSTSVALKLKVANAEMLAAFSAATNWSYLASKFVIA